LSKARVLHSCGLAHRALRLLSGEAIGGHETGSELERRLRARARRPNDLGAAPEAHRAHTAAVIETAAPAIEVDRLRMRYGDAVVSDEITLTVAREETFGLLGPNGAGKTTLLKTILMLTAAQAGVVRLFSEPHHRAGARSRIGYLPERFQPPGHLSGYEFVGLTLALHGRRARRAQTAVMAEQLEIEPGALRPPIREYPKGTAQKLGLLALLLTDLPLLVLDEPMSGLDPKARLVVKRHLAAYRARGRAILLSSPLPGRSRSAVRSDRHPAPRPARLRRHAEQASGAARRADAALRISRRH
jgi:ABC-2 type transport system ATP-binding protein